MTEEIVTKKKPTQAEINAVILDRLDRIERRQNERDASAVSVPVPRNSFFAERAKPVFVTVLKRWQTILIIGLLAFIAVRPFVGGTVRLPIPSPSPIVQKQGIDWIVSQSPDDKTERAKLMKAYRNVAESIESKTISSISKASTAIQTQTQDVLPKDAWTKTADRLTGFTDGCSNVDDFGKKLYEIADAFERANR